jgi:hypothetical protein
LAIGDSGQFQVLPLIGVVAFDFSVRFRNFEHRYQEADVIQQSGKDPSLKYW